MSWKRKELRARGRMKRYFSSGCSSFISRERIAGPPHPSNVLSSGSLIMFFGIFLDGQAFYSPFGDGETVVSWFSLWTTLGTSHWKAVYKRWWWQRRCHNIGPWPRGSHRALVQLEFASLNAEANVLSPWWTSFQATSGTMPRQWFQWCTIVPPLMVFCLNF